MGLGYDFRCVLTTDGKVSCWGHNESGQLGAGDTTSTDTPQTVQYGGSDFDNVSAITAGTSHVCALRNGAAWCWGYNNEVEIGNYMLPSTMNALEPTPVLVSSPMGPLQLDNLHAISAGGSHTCALLNDDTGACWGKDQNGQLGNARSGTNYSSPQTVQVDSGGLQPLVMGGDRIIGGGNHTCALVSDIVANSVACWGLNLSGQLGIGDTLFRSTAVPAVDGRGKIVDAVDVAATGNSTCAVLTDTTVRCWGSDDSFALGLGAGGTNKLIGIVLLASSKFDAFSGAVQIVAGADHFCVRALPDDVYCWGNNDVGQLGSDEGAATGIPTKVSIDTPLFTDNFDGD